MMHDVTQFYSGPREFDPEVTDSEVRRLGPSRVCFVNTNSKVIPKKGDEWDEDSKSYRSYNIEHIAYQPRSEARRLDVKLDMEVNLKPAVIVYPIVLILTLKGFEKPLSQISFIHRDQILIWVSDPASKAQLRGIVVSMSVNKSGYHVIHMLISLQNYLDDIRNGGLEPRREPLELDLTNAGGGGYNITAVVPRAPYSRQGISSAFFNLETTDRRSSEDKA
ncbi:hypothetical protein B0H11DRAFT_1326030 [Mycena galericulata]|nr:hypothetical protein B0H11DRAFT_1326030 [Mycena galericulata]